MDILDINDINDIVVLGKPDLKVGFQSHPTK